ncbi:hypothetical protein [Tamlana flava]|uniref:hypothetical protein n=1 Tax=Tamlana flava TaxID=3158572 RepID=UPI00351B8E53
MNKTIYYLFIIFLVSCKNNSELAKEYYILGEFDLARIELQNLKNPDKNDIALYKKIDSLTLEKAKKKYLVEYDEYVANYLLQKITSDSPVYNDKLQFLEQKDSILEEKHLEDALLFFEKNKFNKSLEYLNRIDTSSHLNLKRQQLAKRIDEEKIKNRDKELLISKAVISSIFGRPPSIMTSSYNPEGYYNVVYYFDGSNYKNKVRFDGYDVNWGAEPGRWRSDKLAYSEKNDIIYVYEIFNDGSKRVDEFKMNDLK